MKAEAPCSRQLLLGDAMLGACRQKEAPNSVDTDAYAASDDLHHPGKGGEAHAKLLNGLGEVSAGLYFACVEIGGGLVSGGICATAAVKLNDTGGEWGQVGGTGEKRP